MEFFDKLGKKASEAYKVTADKTGKLAKEAKLRMKMNELKSEINDIYKDIGKVVYENYIREEKQDLSNDLEEKCTKINCLSDEIEVCLKECLELKDKKKCPNCYVQIDKEVKFCPECGIKQEVEEDPAREVEIVDKADDKKVDNEESKTESNKNEKQKNSDDKSNLEKTVEVEADVKLEDDITIEHLKVEDEQDD